MSEMRKTEARVLRSNTLIPVRAIGNLFAKAKSLTKNQPRDCITIPLYRSGQTKLAIGSARGQAFEAYRLLIAMVLALAVLLIILSAISYFDSLRQKVSQDTMYSSWKSAVDSPNGKIIRASNLYFTAETRFSRVQFAKQVGLDSSCVQFDAEPDVGFELNDEDIDNPFVLVSQNVGGVVYFQCRADNFIIPLGDSSCLSYCLISFGKPILEDGAS